MFLLEIAPGRRQKICYADPIVGVISLAKVSSPRDKALELGGGYALTIACILRAAKELHAKFPFGRRAAGEGDCTALRQCVWEELSTNDTSQVFVTSGEISSLLSGYPVFQSSAALFPSPKAGRQACGLEDLLSVCLEARPTGGCLTLHHRRFSGLCCWLKYFSLCVLYY